MTDRNSPEPTGRDPGSKPGFGSDGVAWPQLSGLSNDLYLHPTVRTLRDGGRIPGGREGGRAGSALLRKWVWLREAARRWVPACLQTSATDLRLNDPAPAAAGLPGQWERRQALLPAHVPCYLWEEEVTCYVTHRGWC